MKAFQLLADWLIWCRNQLQRKWVTATCTILMFVGTIGGSIAAYARPYSGFTYAVDLASIPTALLITRLLLGKNGEKEDDPAGGLLVGVLCGVMAAFGGFAGGFPHVQGRWIWLTLFGATLIWFFAFEETFHKNNVSYANQLGSIMFIGAVASTVSTGVSYGPRDWSFVVSVIAIFVTFLLLAAVAAAKEPTPARATRTAQ